MRKRWMILAILVALGLAAVVAYGGGSAIANPVTGNCYQMLAMPITTNAVLNVSELAECKEKMGDGFDVFMISLSNHVVGKTITFSDEKPFVVGNYGALNNAIGNPEDGYGWVEIADSRPLTGIQIADCNEMTLPIGSTAVVYPNCEYSE